MKFVLISSDGISQLSNAQLNSRLSTMHILEELTAFKGTKGKFLQRRANKALKQFEQDGFKPFDDLSLGILYNHGSSPTQNISSKSNKSSSP